MAVEIETFKVSARKHETDALDTQLVWKVLIQVKFKSEDPANWGELRAYGGSWIRTLNRSHDYDFMTDTSTPNPKLKSRPNKKEDWTQLETDTTLPFWGSVQGPPKEDGMEWRIGNDQHIEIFYAKKVLGVPRSDPASSVFLPDDDNTPDDLGEAESPGDIDLRTWHIVGRDEPTRSPIHLGDFVEYWHQAEFQIRDPKTRMVLPEKKRLFLRVSGLYPKYTYSIYHG